MESVIAQKLEGPADDSAGPGDISKQVGISDNLSMVVINDKGAYQFVGMFSVKNHLYGVLRSDFRIVFWVLFVLATRIAMDLQKDREPEFGEPCNRSEEA